MDANRAFPSLPGEKLRQFEYITGHQPLKTFRDKGIDYPAIIVFRDPVRRMVSLFRFYNISRHADHSARKYDSFDEFIGGTGRNRSSQHTQCRFVMGTRIGIHFADEPIDANRALGFLERDHVYPVLLEKHYDDMLTTLSGLLGLKLNNVKKNVSGSQKIHLDQNQLAAVSTLVREDERLYELIDARYDDFKAKFLKSLP